MYNNCCFNIRNEKNILYLFYQIQKWSLFGELCSKERLLSVHIVMSIPFRELTISDKAIILQYTAKSKRRNCDLSFSNLCSWRFNYQTQFAVWKDCLVFKFWVEDKTLAYMMPIGEGDLKSVITDMVDDAAQEGRKFRMLGVCSDMRNLLESIYHNDFDFVHTRDYDDYIYLRSDLAELKGKHYQSKRNFVNRFKKNNQYEYLSLTPDLIGECLSLENLWFEHNDEKTDLATIAERKALTYALNHFEELGLMGGVLRVKDQIVAFTFGMPINYDTFGVHVEKADVSVEGSYAMINYEFANQIPEQYIYVNREEDLGVEGLRKAKLSYHPAVVLEKFMAHLKEQPSDMINW